MKLIDILNESITYKVPNHPSFLLYDFYVLSYIRTVPLDANHKWFSGKFNQPEHLKEDIEHAESVLIPYLKKHLNDVLFLCICAEVKHGFRETDAENEPEFFNNPLFNEYGKLYNLRKYANKKDDSELRKSKNRAARGDYKESWNAARLAIKKCGKTKKDFVEMSKKIFELKWKNSDYGGSTWAKICDGWLRLDRSKNFNDVSIAIDHIYDLHHNSGFALNKVKAYRGSWVEKALDRKRDVKNIRELFPYCSSDMRKLAQQATRASGIPDIPKKPIVYDSEKVWKSGTWTHDNGMQWDGGIWENGTWKNGFWRNGEWMNGTWEDGTWVHGIWHNGIWEKGEWNDGRWTTGRWESGNWLNGNWTNGEWLDGNFCGGNWFDGMWYNGVWYNGTWHGGTWKTGIWKNGIWRGGVWENGTWIDGHWNKGTWKGGKWESGYIYNAHQKFYAESDVSPSEYYERLSPIAKIAQDKYNGTSDDLKIESIQHILLKQLINVPKQ